MTDVRPQLTVLHSVSPPDGTTRYATHMAEGMPAEVRQEFFSYRTGLFGRYDVFHVHWPENLIRARRRSHRVRRRAQMLALLTRLWVTRTPMVRTLHNADPHEQSSSRWESWVLRLVDRRTHLFIRLNPATATPVDRPVVDVPHGHYRDKYPATSRDQVVDGRYLYFGLIRPYKGVDELVDAFSGLPDTELSLHIVGQPGSDELAEQMRAAARKDGRIGTDLRFVPDAALAAEIAAAQLVVLPYRELTNSGAVLLALSLERPVLLPRSISAQAMSDEVGESWVLQFDRPLTADTLTWARSRACATLASPSRPQLDGRDWATVGELHYSAYRRVVGVRERG